MELRIGLFFFVMLTALSEAVLANDPTNKSQPNLSKNGADKKNFLLPTLKNTFKEKKPQLSLQLGGFIGHQGVNQTIEIDGTQGDYFSISHQNKISGLVGLGYFLDAKEKTYATLVYGLNAYYLAKTKINGTITQEQLFTNLSYNYFITNWPIYFSAKALFKNHNSDTSNITLDVGIGPNIIHTSQFNEQPLLGSVIPDHMVAGQTSVAFTGMAGIGYRINHVFGSAPLECGYRFFYLGQSNLRNVNTQLLNHFSTGQSYANALLCSIII